ncbi:MAG: hypothetical protein J6A73_04705 [Lachnospiraceae bacterium]|nr:hypothetical protein [Lachnospiraceae bacterium]
MNVVDLKSVLSDDVLICILSSSSDENGPKRFKSFYYGRFGDVPNSLLGKSVMDAFPASYNRLNIYIME